MTIATRAAAAPFLLRNVAPACRGEDPELFFPLPGHDFAAAREICARCPLREPCAAWAIESGERYGIFGGLGPEDRSRARAAGLTRYVSLERTTP